MTNEAASGLALLRTPFSANQISKQTAPNGLAKPCQIFMGALDGKGYGRVGRNGRLYGAHQWSYICAHGAVPPGLELDHLCRVTACVEPTHLEPVTHAENCRRGRAGEAVGAQNRAKAFCPQGHPYYGDNLYTSRNGTNRACKQCRLAANRRFYHRQKETHHA